MKNNHQGRYENAINDYTKAIDLDPNYFQAYISRGNARANIGQVIEAIEDYTVVIDSEKPNSALYLWQAYFNRGNAYTQQRKYDSAISDYTQALEMKMIQRGGNTYYSIRSEGERVSPTLIEVMRIL